VPAFFAVGAVGVIAYEEGGLPPWAQVLAGLVILAGMATKQLVPGWVYNELRDRLEKAEARVTELTDKNLSTQETVLPALKESSLAVKEAMEELRFQRRRE